MALPSCICPRYPAMALAVALFFAIANSGCVQDGDPAANGQNGDPIADAGHDANDSDNHNDDDSGFDGGDADIPDSEGSDTDRDADTDSDADGDPDADDADSDTEEPLEPLAIDSLRPGQGSVEGGTPFVLEGQGFTDQTTLLFGGEQATVSIVDNALTGITPAADIAGPVTVRALDEITGEATLVDGFQYVDPLAYDDLSPARISTAGGVWITVTGDGFTDTTRAVVGDRAAMAHEFVSPSQIRFLAPPHAAGPTTIKLVDSQDNLSVADALTYVAPLQLDALDPPLGSAQGGDEILLQGRQFDDSLAVFFDEEPATVLGVNPAGTEAVVATPAGPPGAVDVRVEANDDGARLDDGFVYTDDTAGDLAITAIVPAQGPTTGGESVYLVGQFTDLNNPQVSFGGQPAPINDANDEAIVVTAPASAAAGSVDVVVSSDDGASISQADGYDYFTPLAVDSLSPASGDVEGGTEVVVEGTGFDAVDQLVLGGQQLPFEIIDDQTLSFSTTAASAGPADLQLRTHDGRLYLREQAFEFMADLEVWNLSPLRGAISGNTYVELRGQGLTDDLAITFGGEAATDIERVDAYTATLRTPAHPSGAVEVTASTANHSATAPELFTYFNPGAASGGAFGNPIDGAVNISVFTTNGQPIEGAFVMLSTNAQTPYAGATDDTGRITLSGPDIIGTQTVTATAAEHTSTTVQYVDAENITIFLSPAAEGSGPMPPPPPSATFTGEITGLDKLASPGPDQQLMAYVESTRPTTIFDQIPPPGTENVVIGGGHYEVRTRIGDLALVATAGLYTPNTGEFEPLRMGVARSLVAANGGEYDVDIDLNIPLNAYLDIKFDGAPMPNGGPTNNHVDLFLQLGVDGVYGPMHMQTYSQSSQIVPIDAVAELTGPLDDATYTANLRSDTGGTIPYSQSVRDGIDTVNTTINSDPIVSTVDIITPESGTTIDDGLVQWTRHGTHEPDFYWVIVDDMMAQPLWHAFVPGDATSFQFPEFPDLDDYAQENADGETVAPLPYPGGTFRLTIVGIAKEGASVENFSYDDLSLAQSDGYSVAVILVGF